MGTVDDLVIEASFDEAEFRVGIEGKTRAGKRRRNLQYRAQPIMIIHAVLAYFWGGVLSTLDIVVPPACLFGTTSVDLCSALLVRLAHILETFGTTRRLAVVLHHDAAPACIRAGVTV